MVVRRLHSHITVVVISSMQAGPSGGFISWVHIVRPNLTGQTEHLNNLVLYCSISDAPNQANRNSKTIQSATKNYKPIIFIHSSYFPL